MCDSGDVLSLSLTHYSSNDLFPINKQLWSLLCFLPLKLLAWDELLQTILISHDPPKTYKNREKRQEWCDASVMSCCLNWFCFASEREAWVHIYDMQLSSAVISFSFQDSLYVHHKISLVFVVCSLSSGSCCPKLKEKKLDRGVLEFSDKPSCGSLSLPNVAGRSPQIYHLTEPS